MSTAAIVLAAQTVLQAAFPEFLVVQGIPRTFNDDRLGYLFHDGSSDTVLTIGGGLRRTHVIAFHLLIRATADDVQAEAELYDLHDRLCDLFYRNHTIGGTTANATLRQRDAGGLAVTQTPYVVYGGAEYRHRWWGLEAVEALTITPS